MSRLEQDKASLNLKIRQRYWFIKQAAGTDVGKDYTKLVTKIDSMREKSEDDLRKAYRRQYFYHIHNEELERQLNQIETNEYVAPAIEYQLMERGRLQQVMCDFRKGLTPDDIVRRRIHAVNLSAELCSRQVIPLPNPHLIIKNETSSENSSGEDSWIDVKESTLNLALFPLIYKKT
jgi:hypothetical protein